jgi:hypothetical protein
VTAGNVEWIRANTTKYITGADEPALFQAKTGFYAWDDANAPWNGLCQTCHQNTDWHRNDDSHPSHPPSHAHQMPNDDCRGCHPHTDGFRGSGGDCTECHNRPREIAPPSGTFRRQIVDGFVCTGDGTTACTTDPDCSAVGGTCELADGEFGTAFTSHHVVDWVCTGDGTTACTADADCSVVGGTCEPGGEVVTKWDCVVCHAEGDAITGDSDSTYHQKDGVQLKDVDNNDVGMGNGPVYDDWSGLTPSQRSDFCLSCHDANGATNISTRTDLDPDATTNALNPFNDSLTNAHEPDGLDGATPAPHLRPRVLDVEAQFNTSNVSHHAALGPAYVFAADCVAASDPHSCCTGAGTGPTCDLPFGSGVDNAILGVRTDLAWNSELDCEDCHYGTATTKLSAHGTLNARYMLRDKDSNDTLAVDPNTNCYRCHSPADAVSVYPEHDKSAHIDDSQNLYGIACLNCHGGGEWGGIHGVDAPVTDDGGAGSYNPNAFTYGSGLDYISNWSSWANRGVGCSSKSGADRINACDHHGGVTEWSRGETRTYRAP